MTARSAFVFTILYMVCPSRIHIIAAASVALPYRAVRECATCHAAQAKPQPATSMAHALELPAECTILKNHSLLTFKDGPYSYRIERKGDQSIYSVTDGQNTLTAPIGWAFGLGGAGQTYVYSKDGQLYQTRVSYFSDIDGLDFTLGALNAKPKVFAEAAGQLMDHNEQLACFGCHATNATQGRKLNLDALTPGLQCERCHGPADNHVQGVRLGDAKLAAMNHLRSFSSEQMSNFCGQCHRTWEQIAVSSIRGVVNVRFQPYRLTNSKCYDADDSRIRCTSCHDPHQEVNRKDAAYDSKCQTCHAGGKAAARPCKVAKSDCVSCHMPKVEIPGSHFKFTDHEIRIVRANAPFPD
jgi:Cytochrome c554 and c-prime